MIGSLLNLPQVVSKHVLGQAIISNKCGNEKKMDSAEKPENARAGETGLARWGLELTEPRLRKFTKPVAEATKIKSVRSPAEEAIKMRRVALDLSERKQKTAAAMWRELARHCQDANVDFTALVDAKEPDGNLTVVERVLWAKDWKSVKILHSNMKLGFHAEERVVCKQKWIAVCNTGEQYVPWMGFYAEDIFCGVGLGKKIRGSYFKYSDIEFLYPIGQVHDS